MRCRAAVLVLKDKTTVTNSRPPTDISSRADISAPQRKAAVAHGPHRGRGTSRPGRSLRTCPWEWQRPAQGWGGHYRSFAGLSALLERLTDPTTCADLRATIAKPVTDGRTSTSPEAANAIAPSPRSARDAVTPIQTAPYSISSSRTPALLAAYLGTSGPCWFLLLARGERGRRLPRRPTPLHAERRALPRDRAA